MGDEGVVEKKSRNEQFDMKKYLDTVIAPMSEREWLSTLYSHVMGASERQLIVASAMVRDKMMVIDTETLTKPVILAEENASLRAEVARLARLLPDTFYADRDLLTRVERMVRGWHNATVASRNLQDEVARLEKERDVREDVSKFARLMSAAMDSKAIERDSRQQPHYMKPEYQISEALPRMREKLDELLYALGLTTDDDFRTFSRASSETPERAIKTAVHLANFCMIVCAKLAAEARIRELEGDKGIALAPIEGFRSPPGEAK